SSTSCAPARSTSRKRRTSCSRAPKPPWRESTSTSRRALTSSPPSATATPTSSPWIWCSSKPTAEPRFLGRTAPIMWGCGGWCRRHPSLFPSEVPTMPTESRVFNFSSGPAVLPEPVLLEAQRNLFALPGVGMSILEISHRSKTFDEVIGQAKADMREVAGISDDYDVLFLQGGASLQFSMVPMNLMPAGGTADYVVTG